MKLLEDVEMKSRIDLYYKQGLGLHFVVLKGALNYIKLGDKVFFEYVIND